MLCPLEVEAPLTPRLHKHEPLEIHWRKNPPTCRGDIEKAYYRVYPQLVQEVLCFQCGAIPCPYNHDDTDKKQRLADLDFIKDLAKESREMKEELKKLRFQVDTYIKQEEEWNHTKVLLDSEIRRLKLLNEQNKDIMDELKRDQLRLKYVQQKLEDAELENQQLKAENERCIQRLYSQSEDIEKLTKNNDILKREVETSKSKVKKLVVQIEESKGELAKAKEQVKIRDDKIAQMEKDIADLVSELTQKTRVFEQKELEFQSLVSELKELVTNLKKSNKESNNKIKELMHTIQLLQEEVEMLKRKLASDTRFRQFVEIKRECNVLKDVSGNMAQKLQNYENKTPLPVVKKSGKVAKKSKAYGPGARPTASLLNRPTSAKVSVKPIEDESSGGGGELANLNDFDDESRPGSAMFTRPKSGRSQFRSPSVISCIDDADLYILNEDRISPSSPRPGSALKRSLSSRYPSKSPLVSSSPDRESVSPTQNWSRPTSRMGPSAGDIPNMRDNFIPEETLNTGAVTIATTEDDEEAKDYSQSPYINRDTLGFSLEDVKRHSKQKTKLHSSPASSYDGSDFENFTFEKL